MFPPTKKRYRNQSKPQGGNSKLRPKPQPPQNFFIFNLPLSIDFTSELYYPIYNSVKLNKNQD